MLSSGKESVVSSTSTGDQEDASRKVEIEVETGVVQGGLLIIQVGRFKLLQVLLSLGWRMITP